MPPDDPHPDAAPSPGDRDSPRDGTSPRDGDFSVRRPTGLPSARLRPALRRALAEAKADELVDRAAALTYYGVLALFPALLALVSVLGLLGGGTITSLIDDFGPLLPGPVRDLVVAALRQVEGDRGAAGLTLVIGVVLALWSASGYVAAFTRSANVLYDIGEGRPVWKTLPVRFAVTLVLVVAVALGAVGVVFTGGLAHRAGERLGVGDTGQTVWGYAKWPVLVLLVALVIGLLYWAAPNVRRGFSWVVPGGLLAVTGWLAASALFGLYVAHFSDYAGTYGSFAAVIVFLVWLWLTNCAILFGLEFTAELERERAMHDGHPPTAEPYAEPRDTRKL